MKKVFFILFVILTSGNVFSQIGGLSASKLYTLNTETVQKNAIEFEPSFGFYNSKYYWDNDSKLQENFIGGDSSIVSTSMCFRFTYGVGDKIEAGVSISDNVTFANWGIKYNFFTKNKTQLAFIAGLNTPLGNRNVDLQNKSTENSIATGLVLTQKFNDKFSIDANAQYQKHLFVQANNHLQDYFLNLDLGYYIIEKIQIVSGFNFSFSDGTITENCLIFNPGVTIEKAKNFILVMQLPYTVFGKNTQKSLGFGMALTISIK